MEAMKGGTGEESYAKNSSLQRKLITNAMPILKEAIKDVYCRHLPKTLCISDLGCSSGPNTFYVISMLLETVDSIRRSLGHESPEFLIHLSDLPTNDFNTIFKSFPKFQEDLNERTNPKFGPCFLTGVPGSFYGRLFPCQSLHFVHSSNSLHWLSQAPKEAYGNKGNVFISTKSHPDVVNAYIMQFKNDFTTFLRCRAMELVVGGCMVITLPGRRLEDPYAWENTGSVGFLFKTLNDMVDEGLIEKGKLDSFNMPSYRPSVPELKTLIEKEGSFSIIRQGTTNLHLVEDEKSTPDSIKKGGLDFSKTVRAVYEPLLCIHFSEDIIDELFSRLGEVYKDHLSKELTRPFSFTLSLIKKNI